MALFQNIGREQLPRMIILILLATGLALQVGMMRWGVADDNVFTHNIFYHFFAWHDWPVALVLLIFFLVCPKRGGREFAFPGWLLPVVIGGAFLVAWVGHFGIMFSFPLSTDDYLMLFQARTYQGFEVFPRIPEEWLPMEAGLRPGFTRFDEAGNVWKPQYLPVHAAILALFAAGGLGSLVNPLANAASVWFVAGIVRRIWPEQRSLPVLAALLLVSSAQFHLWGMSWHSSAMHLCFSLGWVWLYLQDRTWAYLALPWVGGLAIGLHQPHIHALIAFPFLIHLLFQRRWGIVVYTVVVYSGFCALWIWFILEREIGPGAAEMGMRMVGLHAAVFRLMHSILLVTWNHPMAALGTVAGLFYWRRLPLPVQLLLLSFVATFVFYFFFGGHGGHGWGSRYSHPILGHLSVIAIGVWAVAPRVSVNGFSLVSWKMLAGTGLCFLFFLPLRAWQARDFVEPYMKVDRDLRGLDAEVVIVHGEEGYYARDLIRNHPAIDNGPLRIRHMVLPDEKVEWVREKYEVVEFGHEEFRERGLSTVEVTPWEDEAFMEMYRDRKDGETTDIQGDNQGSGAMLDNGTEH